MDDARHSEPPPELAQVARRLQEERPALSGLELDQIKLQVQRRAARPKNTFLSKQRRALMKSRMAITSMLVLGVFAGGTGTGLAVSGISDSGSAGTAQYPPGPNDGGNKPKILGSQEDDNGGGVDNNGGGTDVAGVQETSTASDVQATRQVSVQEEGSLPFTGLAAIPLILLGIGLLASGLVLRRRLPDSA
jgi:hypothetical protein